VERNFTVLKKKSEQKLKQENYFILKYGQSAINIASVENN